MKRSGGIPGPRHCGSRFAAALIVASCMLTLAAPARAQDPSLGMRFQFALIGDAPYDGKQEREFTHLMKAINAAELEFVVHNGDFQWDGAGWNEGAGGMPPCADGTFADRLRLAQSSRHPFIFTPGDNDWTDCHRSKPHAYAPLERLGKLRQLFFEGDQSLGQSTLTLTRQSESPDFRKFRENARWVYGDVLFVTLHIVGSNDNLGRTPEMDAEHAERSAANMAWMRHAFGLAKRSGLRAVMIISQANPRFENTWTPVQQNRYLLGGLGIKPPEKKRVTGYDAFLKALEEEVVAFGRPVAYVHGDTHVFRVDKPLVGSVSRRTIENFTRVEVFGYPDTHWVRATVDPRDPNVFSFRPEIVRENRATH
jgi:hypothetical protein